MRSLLVCSILAVGLAWAQHSVAAPVNKHASPLTVDNYPSHIPNGPIVARLHAQAACEHPLTDFLHVVAAKSKHMAISPSLTAKQYAFVQDEIKKHSKDHKPAAGDGAMVIDSDGQFLLAATMGANVCTIVPIPGELVEAIVAVDEPPVVATPPVPKADPERPRL